MAEQGKTLQKSAISRHAEDQWMGKIQGENKIHLSRILDQHGPFVFRLQQGIFDIWLYIPNFLLQRKCPLGVSRV